MKIKDIMKNEFVYTVKFYDGYIDGYKYDVTKENTTYMSFHILVGAHYFSTPEAAQLFADSLNKEYPKGQ